MSKLKLKPCPFCGEELVILQGKNYYAHDLKRNKPVECYAGTLVFRVDDEESIRRWNMRKPIDNILEKLKVISDGLEEDIIDDQSTFGEYYATTRAIKIVEEFTQ